MPISYEEQVGSCSYSIQKGGATATRIFTVNWADAFAFAKELYGQYTTWPEDKYQEPNTFPYVAHLKCESVDVEGIGKQGESSNASGIYITYDKAKVTAKYGVANFGDLLNEDDPSTLEEESLSVAAEIGTAEDGAWIFTADAGVVPDTAMPAIIEPTITFSVTRLHVSSLPDSDIADLAGSVNDAIWRGYSIGAALFIGAEARRSITTDGAEDWEVTYFFKIKTHSWNHVYRSETGHGHYEEVKTKTGNDLIFPENSFDTLGV